MRAGERTTFFDIAENEKDAGKCWKDDHAMTLLHKQFWYNGGAKDCCRQPVVGERVEVSSAAVTPQLREVFTFAEGGGRCCGSSDLGVECLMDDPEWASLGKRAWAVA